MTADAISQTDQDEFRHEALFYDGLDDFVERIAAFVREGAGSGEAVLVVVTGDKLGPLREAVGDDEAVTYGDMLDVGRNPARIIPVWHEFVDRHMSAGTRVRGVGEPIFVGRSTDELEECRRHELLLNLAFATSPAWWLLCPYDVRTLEPEIIDAARRNHPVVCDNGDSCRSHTYAADGRTVFQGVLPPPPGPYAETAFDGWSLEGVRRFVVDEAMRLGLAADRTGDLVLAVHELATNSVRHGGGGGGVRMWTSDGAVVCEVRDTGRIDRPLVGRVRPGAEQENGRGLWLVNHLCDLVQVRSAHGATVVRVHMRPAHAG